MCNLRLIAEAPNVAPDTYWLYTDNYLAALALRDLKPDVAASILQGMEKYDFEPLQRYHVVDGKCVSGGASCSGRLGSRSRHYRWHDDKEHCPGRRYRNERLGRVRHRLLETAMNVTNCGEEAQALFEDAQQMFNGDAFLDMVYKNDAYKRYETY